MENMRKVRKTMMKVLGYLIIFLFYDDDSSGKLPDHYKIFL